MAEMTHTTMSTPQIIQSCIPLYQMLAMTLVR